MKAVLIVLILLQGAILFGQKMSYYAGINSTVFHDYNRNEGHYYSNYQSSRGYTFGIQLDSLNSWWWNIPVSFQFERYSAALVAQDGGLGGTYGVNARINKSLLSLNILPLNFSFKSRFHLNLGIQLSLLLKEKTQGIYSYWVYMQGSRTGNLADQYAHYSRSGYVGATAQISYDLWRTKAFVLGPRYGYYFGFSNEFREFPETTKRMQHFLGIQMRRN